MRPTGRVPAGLQPWRGSSCSPGVFGMVAVASIPSEVPGIRSADGHVRSGQRERATRGQAEVNRSGRYVLYWMIAQRRLRSHFALQRAADWARRLSLPLVVLEPLEVDY